MDTNPEKPIKDEEVSIYTLHFPEEAARHTLNAQLNRWINIKFIIKTSKKVKSREG
jgi:hypothetical protein